MLLLCRMQNRTKFRDQNSTLQSRLQYCAVITQDNDEEVASFKKHTQFKTRVHKPYPISDQTGQNRCFFSDQKKAKKPNPLTPPPPPRLGKSVTSNFRIQKILRLSGFLISKKFRFRYKIRSAGIFGKMKAASKFGGQDSFP